jgi:hypothetical protein
MTIIGPFLGFVAGFREGRFDRLGVGFSAVTDVGRVLGTSLGTTVGVRDGKDVEISFAISGSSQVVYSSK